VSEVGLGEAEVLATSRHGSVERLAEIFVRLVLWEIELYYDISIAVLLGVMVGNLRLKQV
jgi:hypothetical protein